MLSQVGKLGPQYKVWVSAPVDRNLRLFSWDILEYMTVTPWYLIPVVWLPVSVFFIYHGWLTNEQDITGKVTVTITMHYLDKVKIHNVAFWAMTLCCLVAEY
jgi:4-hydroxysphinganine ceramide fatty acyl 2-hydroxylase